MERRHVRVHGRVQGVCFRDTLRQAAVRHGVVGWARNCPDGTVEAVFEGAPADVERLVDVARRGPSGAHVTRLDVSEERVEGLAGFRIVG